MQTLQCYKNCQEESTPQEDAQDILAVGTKENLVIIEDDAVVKGSKENPIISNDWIRNSVSTKYKKHLGKVYLDLLPTPLNDFVQENCLGCFRDHPSQKHPSCLTADRMEVLEANFIELLCRVSEKEENKMCHEQIKKKICTCTLAPKL